MGTASEQSRRSGQSNTPKCSQASIRAVAASRVLASSRRSWVSSQVSRARRDRAEGSLSKSAGNRPRASTNSRMRRTALGVRRRSEQQLEPGHATLGQAGAGDAETGAPPRFAFRQRIRQIAGSARPRIHPRAAPGWHRTAPSAADPPAAAPMLRPGNAGSAPHPAATTRPRTWTAQPSCVGRVRHGSQCSGSAAHRNYVTMGLSVS